MPKCAICDETYDAAYDACPECATGLAKCVVQVKDDVRQLRNVVAFVIVLGLLGVLASLLL